MRRGKCQYYYHYAGHEVDLEAVLWVGCSVREAREGGDNVRQEIR